MAVWVDGVDETSGRQVRALVGHGEHPVGALARCGWIAERLLGAQLGTPTDPTADSPTAESPTAESPTAGELVVRYAARPSSAHSGLPQGDGDTDRAAGAAYHAACAAYRGGEPGRRSGPVRRDPGLVLAPGERPVPVQRVTAHALVSSSRGLLLSQLSERTHAAGQWSLPGGGLDPGEEPVQALHREVFEETGQRVRIASLVQVLDAHWIGRAPHGRLEDFHAVRLLYRADCPEPTDPVVHEMGGTTAAARWVRPAELVALPCSSTWAATIRGWAGQR